MRHLAWLHATPEGDKLSRFHRLRNDSEFNPLLRMPEFDDESMAGYIIGLLQEAGLMSSTGMGPFPLSWQELEAWVRTTGRTLSVWEKLTVKGLSEEYVSELLQAKEKNRLAPYQPADSEIDRPAIANKISSFVAMFNKMKK